MTEKTEAPQTKLSDWQVRMTPRNLDGKRSELITVQATSKQEAINKALSMRPGHVWDSVIELDEEGSETGNEDENEQVDGGEEETPTWAHWDVTLYRSGFEDITVRLVAKDKQQACQKAIRAYGSWNVVRTRPVEPPAAKPLPDGRKWRPTTHMTDGVAEPHTLAQIVQEVVGTGSMCWEPRPEGVFDSTRAAWAAEGAIEAIEQLFAKPRRRLGSAGIDPLDLIREQNVDGQLWAIAFAEQFDLPEEHDSTIIGWFANAIETAKSYVRNSRRPADIFGADLPPFESFGEKAEARTNLVPNPALVDGSMAETGMAQEPEECRQARIQRDADKAAVIELILSYRNPADDETRMRQIKVVMD